MWRRGVWLGGVAVLVTPGCGGTTKTVTEQTPVAANSPAVASAPGAAKPKPRHKVAHLNNPAQQPDPNVTTACDKAPLGHACVASTSVDGDPNESRQRNCDTNIVANANTSCALAENIFWEAYEHGGREGRTPTAVEAHSPVTQKDYEMDCVREGGLIGCESSPIGAGLFVSFPAAAIQSYTAAQAAAYGRSGKVGHPGPPAADSTPSAPESAPSGGASGGGGEESEHDEVGSYSHGGDSAFCEEHDCIGDFESEEGYVVECQDGTYSHAGAIQGACSDHGGESKP
jgi:hypothetical protein